MNIDNQFNNPYTPQGKMPTQMLGPKAQRKKWTNS